MHPTGRQIELAADGYTVAVTEVGATLRTFAYDGRPLIAGFAARESMPDFNGAVLAPWPNRIRDGRYDFGGRTHQLPVSEPSRGTALHGVVAWQPWAVQHADRSAAELSTVIYPQRGYPFLLTLTARYSLDATGLRVEMSARNEGAADAPYGVSIHPWFVTGPEPLAEWVLTLPAAEVMTTDDRLLPTGVVPVDGELDFRSGRPLGDIALDHAFTGIEFPDGVATATLRAPGGAGVELSWGPDSRWVQVCTGDQAGPDVNRRAIAIEPMSCPPDAFRSGDGLVRLTPGQTHSLSWRFAAIS
ncbi:MAG: aldose 1-epimerase family protein [Jatrophihabitans sp.]|uniref:aldose 1-epimerase family protein n=1 Tax=Jatrophihabitans sp. TaxID=1932789 RepID=UPI00390E5C30